MQRTFTRFVGIDLGGARGKTTAVADLEVATDGRVLIRAASTRTRERAAWTDAALWTFIETLPADAVIAINAPLTAPACVRCPRPVCPGIPACDEPAVQWLRGPGEQLIPNDSDAGVRDRLRFPPYLHRATEVHITHVRGLSLVSMSAASSSQVAARAGQLRRRLADRGFVLDDNLLEVSPVAALTAWFGHRRARGYKYDADPWPTRASTLAALTELHFAPTSRFARDEVVRSVHVFDAVIAAYVGYRWARDAWRKPDDACADDGWIWTPPDSTTTPDV